MEIERENIKFSGQPDIVQLAFTNIIREICTFFVTNLQYMTCAPT